MFVVVFFAGKTLFSLQLNKCSLCWMCSVELKVGFLVGNVLVFAFLIMGGCISINVLMCFCSKLNMREKETASIRRSSCLLGGSLVSDSISSR